MSSTSRQHVPQRTCIVCRQTKPKRDLIRIVHTPIGKIEIDEKGKKSGRGAYVCKTRECWDRAAMGGRKDRLSRALKTKVTPDGFALLSDYARIFFGSDDIDSERN